MTILVLNRGVIQQTVRAPYTECCAAKGEMLYGNVLKEMRIKNYKDEGSLSWEEVGEQD